MTTAQVLAMVEKARNEGMSLEDVIAELAALSNSQSKMLNNG